MVQTQSKPRHLQCCCCGRDTQGRQWYNRDKGYGLCPDCAERLSTRETPEQMHSYYGIAGTHYFTKGGRV